MGFNIYTFSGVNTQLTSVIGRFVPVMDEAEKPFDVSYYVAPGIVAQVLTIFVAIDCCARCEGT